MVGEEILARRLAPPHGLDHRKALVQHQRCACEHSRPIDARLAVDEALAAERLYGCSLDGTWLHVGTPQGVQVAERILQEK